MFMTSPPLSKPPGRRVRRLPINTDIFVQFLVDLAHLPHADRLSLHGMPKDARCVGVFSDREVNSLILLIESDTFTEVPHGDIYPEMMVTMTRHHGGAA